MWMLWDVWTPSPCYVQFCIGLSVWLWWHVYRKASVGADLLTAECPSWCLLKPVRQISSMTCLLGSLGKRPTQFGSTLSRADFVCPVLEAARTELLRSSNTIPLTFSREKLPEQCHRGQWSYHCDCHKTDVCQCFKVGTSRSLSQT